MMNFYVVKNRKAVKSFKTFKGALNFAKNYVCTIDFFQHEDRDIIEIKDLRTGAYMDIK